MTDRANWLDCMEKLSVFKDPANITEEIPAMIKTSKTEKPLEWETGKVY